MRVPLDISKLIISASLVSSSALSSPDIVRSPIEKTKENTFQVLSGKESMKRLGEDIEKNTTTYLVQKNDTVASIANSIGVSTIEIVNLNSFLGKPLLQRGKTGDNILIKLGQDIFIPKDKEIFKNHIDRIDEYTKVDKLNQQVLAGKKDAIAIEPIFASSVQSIGLPNILSGFIQSQQISYDPNHPRVVDRQWQTQVTCANAMRTLMGQSMNIVDLSPKEQVFQRKQNVDAWMLPTELIIIGYSQQFGEIMEIFDSRSVGSADPIKKERLSEYRQAIRAMNNYLEKNGDSAVGSFVPYYFKRSHYKDVVAEYNRSRKDKHYNTHQSMFAGNATMQFRGWNVPLIRDGKMESFGMEKKSIVIEMGQKQNEKLNVWTDSLTPLQRILKSSDPVNNLEIGETWSIKPFYQASSQRVFQEYNGLRDLGDKEKNNLKASEVTREKSQEAITVIDFILNFIQSRSDFGGSLSESFRKEIFSGLSIYGDVIHMKINGKPVNVLTELETYKSDRKMSTMISPEDTFEITGPMMIDGEKQSTHADISRQKAMNIRTRFFFEFFLSETYLPTELLIPGKESSYVHQNVQTSAGRLKIKGVYGLQMKYDEQGEYMRNKNGQVLTENIEEVLLREIIKYESLNPTDPKFKEKLRRHYGLQIKALQMAGFLQDENTLNKSAVNINRAIPYYDGTNISKIFESYIREKKQEIHSENKRLAEIKNFIDIRILPGDTYRQIFSSITKYISVLGEAGNINPHLRELSRIQDYKKRIFVERFLTIASRESEFNARRFLENPKPFTSFILSLESLESISEDIAEITYMEAFSGLSDTDQRVINLATSDDSYRHMLTNILAVESYGESRSMFTRRNLKKFAKNFGVGSSSGDYQLRISSLLSDLENDKTLEISMKHLFRTLDNQEVQLFLGSFDTTIQKKIRKDLEHIETIRRIVSDSKGTSLPKRTIAKELSSVMRFDDGDGSNVISKFISASLLIDKLSLHSEKLDYMLVSAGYDVSKIFDDRLSMEEYERTIIRINNLPENQMLLALAENFILRIAEEVSGTGIPTKTVFNESVLSKGKYLGQIRYDKNIFVTHLEEYQRIMNSGKTDPKIQFFLKKLDIFITSMKAHPGDTNENIYRFLRDKELRTFLKEEDIDGLILPLKREWNKDSFRSSVFNYVNKIEILRKKRVIERVVLK